MSNSPIPLNDMTSSSHIVQIPSSRSSTPTPTFNVGGVLDKVNLDARVQKTGTEYKFDFRGITWEKISDLILYRRHLLSHPCIEAYLSAKWKDIRIFFIANFVFFLSFIVTFTVLIWMIENPSWNPNGKHFKYSTWIVHCVADLYTPCTIGSNTF